MEEVYPLPFFLAKNLFIVALSRQIHLDFHCSELIKDIGNQFDAKSFKVCLKKAKVNSINLFAKCHHSWSYYPTKVGNVHPNLSFDLLGKQIEACREVGIAPHIYFTVGWSANDAEAHPEWCARNRDGSCIINGSNAELGAFETLHSHDAMESLPHFYWKFLCLNSSYHRRICEQVEELCQSYTVDGFWFDIYQVHRLCFCEHCMKSLEEQGCDPEDRTAHETFQAAFVRAHCRELTDLIHRYLPEASVFFNGTTALEAGINFRHKLYVENTTQDLEDLPTTWGGYDKLPMQSKFFLNAGYPITAMSGKFHTDWGEFGGFKHPDALLFEAASMIAFGAQCNFGDQLHPDGQIDESTYDHIGRAYDYVEQIEAFGMGGKPMSRLGVWRSFDEASDEGLCKLLLEEQVDFNIANFSEDFSEYSTLILPSKVRITEAVVAKIETFIGMGGAVLVMGDALLNFSHKTQSSAFAVNYTGLSTDDCDYTKVRPILEPFFVNSPFLNYEPALKVQALEGAEILADIHEPYFSRRAEHFCSHQKTPFKRERSECSALIRKQKCIYFAHSLDTLYYKHGARVHRELFHKVLTSVYKDPMVEVSLPSSGRVSLLHQEAEKRYVLHLLYSPPIQRGRVAVIEDFIELVNVEVRFNFPKKIESVQLIPDGIQLPHSIDSQSRMSVCIPKFKGHCLLAFSYVS